MFSHHAFEAYIPYLTPSLHVHLNISKGNKKNKKCVLRHVWRDKLANRDVALSCIW